MASIDIQSDSKPCWECFRRGVACDGSIPICGNCRSARMVCPGYGNKRPLIFLPPGKVSRLQKSSYITSGNSGGAERQNVKVRGGVTPPTAGGCRSARPSTYRFKAMQGSRPDKVQSKQKALVEKPVSSSALVKREVVVMKPWAHTELPPRQLRLSQLIDLEPPGWEFAELMRFYNDVAVPEAMSRDILIVGDFPKISGPTLGQMSPSFRHAFLVMCFGVGIRYASHARGLDVVSSRNGPLGHLWSKFYQHIGLTLHALNEEIEINDVDKMNSIFPNIYKIVIAEIYINNSASWRTHIFGLLTLITQCGGPRKLMSSGSIKPYVLQNFLIMTTLCNTTSPREDQIAEVTRLDLSDIDAIYNIGPATMFLCPAPIFLDIVQINRLRLSCIEPKSGEICRILQHIDDCPTEDWARKTSPSPSYSKYFLLIADIHKSAVAVFGALGVPCTAGSDRHISCESCGRLYKLHCTRLFRLLAMAMEHKKCRIAVPWPIVVAGIASQTGTLSERSGIELCISTLENDLYSRITPHIALRTLRRFWASGKKNWDDCFDKPYPLVV